MAQRKYAIVTDGLWRKSLSVIRSLGKQGYTVTVLGDSYLTIGFWSRYTSRRLICPAAGSDPEAFGRTLISELSSSYYTTKPVLFPMEDATMIWVSQNRNKLETLCDFLIPSNESLEIAEDKGKTMDIAKHLGIEHPSTYHPKSGHEMWNIIRNDITLPCVIKPIFGSGSSGIKYIERIDDTSLPMFEEIWKQYGKCIVQERIPAEGDAIGVNMIYDTSSKCIGHFVHKRLQQYPVSGGPSTDRISIEDDELVRESRKLLDHLNWTGVAMLEWKEHPVTKAKKLLEINPRFWGSLELATRSGINFPCIYADLCLKNKIESDIKNYSVGVRCRWLIPGDILRYISSPHEKRESLRTFISGLPSSCEEWDWKDLRGFFSVVICTGLLALHPRYWKYIRR